MVLALALTLTLNLGGRLELPIKARKQSDETEAGVGVRGVEAARVLGMTVKYETTPKTRPGPQPFHRTLTLTTPTTFQVRDLAAAGRRRRRGRGGHALSNRP